MNNINFRLTLYMTSTKIPSYFEINFDASVNYETIKCVDLFQKVNQRRTSNRTNTFWILTPQIHAKVVTIADQWQKSILSILCWSNEDLLSIISKMPMNIFRPKNEKIMLTVNQRCFHDKSLIFTTRKKEKKGAKDLMLRWIEKSWLNITFQRQL